jgi:hypothetical protein
MEIKAREGQKYLRGGEQLTNRRRGDSVWLYYLALGALALAGPQIIEPPISKTVPVRDLSFAVELSGSHLATRSGW